MSAASAQTFHVSAEEASQTLAAYLRQQLAGRSWSQVRQLVAARKVQINGNVCVDSARRLKAADVVKVLEQSAQKAPEQEDVKIRYLDGHLVVIEKPAGVTTLRHPEEQEWPERRKQLQPTLDEFLPKVLARYENKKPVRGTLPRIRPVHRLDRETSGVMVFARTVEAERGLGQQFRKHTIHRRYHAIAKGIVTAQTIDTYLVRDRGDKRRGSNNLPNVGKRAITHVRPLEELRGYTLVECQLETGRTHQIRIHLAEMGHPIAGDRVYNQPLFKPPIPDESGAVRVMLHAIELGFEHPVSGQEFRFTQPLPQDMEAVLRRLRKQ